MRLSTSQATAIHVLLPPLIQATHALPSNPSWTFTNLTLAQSLDVTPPGNMTFTLTSTITNRTDSHLACDLPANSRCYIGGTPSDASLQVWLQIMLNVLYVTVNQSVADVGDGGGGEYVVGVGEAGLVCNGEESVVCSLDAWTLEAGGDQW